MQALALIRNGLLSALAVIGAVAVGFLTLHVVADVVLRNVANRPIPATYEIVTNYYMIAMAFVPLAWVERGGGMIQVEAIEPLLSARMRRWSDLFVAAFSTVIYGALAWFTLQAALKNFAVGTFVLAQNTPVPTWPAHFLLPIGFGLAGLVTLTRLFETGGRS